jgi:hypothetical protein
MVLISSTVIASETHGYLAGSFIIIIAAVSSPLVIVSPGAIFFG